MDHDTPISKAGGLVCFKVSAMIFIDRALSYMGASLFSFSSLFFQLVLPWLGRVEREFIRFLPRPFSFSQRPRTRL